MDGLPLLADGIGQGTSFVAEGFLLYRGTKLHPVGAFDLILVAFVYRTGNPQVFRTFAVEIAVGLVGDALYGVGQDEPCVPVFNC